MTQQPHEVLSINLIAVAQGSGMNMVLKAGSTSVLLRDALRRPLAELELGGVKAGLRSLPTGVTQVGNLVLMAHRFAKPCLHTAACSLHHLHKQKEDMAKTHKHASHSAAWFSCCTVTR